MMALLESHRRAAKSGDTKSLVIFVHGYGADGNDLISLADPLAEHMPDTVFYAPDAPNRCKMNPMGFEWFPIPRMDGSTEEAARAGMEEAVALLGDWLVETMKAEGVTAAQTVLVGFSQGTMMSLHVGPRLSDKLAGIVGFSGRLLAPEAIGEVVNKPPVLLVHGDMDDVVPPSSMPEAAEALSGAGFEVYTHVSKGTAHGIAPDGLGLALQFMMEKLKS
ncbi:alpha/beta hydrolase [Neptunicoccus cionae]|uniref:alpha/beta hydrolase n=1 Tax=Neptunicoccus cionae TaxID=2035344 RepID=UPI000C765485|nr:alpha/beta fold hydrolase [Amylibacter cionae]PLS22557.1 phospholipase [Amylibacter cionae]